ncbi:TfoX/Sxy family protein [Candidatus Saccharibacteria bacterium]|nr:TfoX/Sxy family protein [Candidatus Saccharibacteria bacterium]
MASTKEFRDYVLEQLRGLSGITCRPMMGEYLLYLDGVLFGGIYDDRLLVKKTETNAEFEMSEEIPYPTGKPMYMIADVDNADRVAEIVYATVGGLK